MQSVLALLLILFTLPSFANSNQEKLNNITSLKRIAFGSCNNETQPQPLWKDVISQKPDIWIWGGDNIYADWGKSESVERAYRRQNRRRDYSQLKDNVPIIGTWDDHDYAFNNADGDLSFKHISQKLHLDFMDVPANSPRRKQKGIYTSFEFGKEEERIKILILDNRYFKGLEKEAPLLGSKQWEWLENELKNSKAHLHFFVAGLSIFSRKLPYTEEWAHYPGEVNRLRKLLKTYKVKAPVFLTGDKHFSSIFKRKGQLEFMSSGLTHRAPRRTWWWLKRVYPNSYFGLSYGIIDISWEGSTPKLRMTKRNGSEDIHTKNVIWKKNTWKYL